MRGRRGWRRAGSPSLGLIATLVVVFMPAASAAGRGVGLHGPARYWGGTQVVPLDPGPQIPVPAGGGSPFTRATIASSGSGSGSSGVHPDQVLSDEFRFTQWAYVARLANVHWLPSTHSRTITRLALYTEDGFPSVYLVLRSHWDSRERQWILIRIPGRPNGRTGWVLRDALGQFHLTHLALTVNRAQMRMYFYDDGRRIWSAPVGIGRPSMPTPAGHFWINEDFALPASNPYYPYAFGTTDASTLSDWPGGGWVGIHGPYGAPASAIPGQISHGCIRMHVPDAAWLGRHLQVGTPLDVV